MKSIIVTGTSKGIGRAICDWFLDHGHRVIEITRADSITLKSAKENQVIIEFDWKDYDELLRQMNELSISEVDILINNAGYLKTDDLSSADLSDFNRHMEVNVWYPLELTRHLIKREVLSKGAHTLNIGSVGGVQGTLKCGGLFNYSTSKAALASLTEFMAIEWGQEGKSVNYLALGAVNTEMLREAFPGYISEVDPEKMAESICSLAMTFGKNASGKIIQLAKSDPET